MPTHGSASRTVHRFPAPLLLLSVVSLRDNLRQNSSFHESCHSMSPITHFFAGWMLASAFPAGRPTTLTRREKALVVAAAVAPDLDGLGIVPELLTRNTSHPLLWFSQYHHSLHTLAFALICTLAAYIIAGPLFTSGPVSGFTFGPVIQGRRRSRSLSNVTFAPASREPQASGR